MRKGLLTAALLLGIAAAGQETRGSPQTLKRRRDGGGHGMPATAVGHGPAQGEPVTRRKARYKRERGECDEEGGRIRTLLLVRPRRPWTPRALPNPPLLYQQRPKKGKQDTGGCRRARTHSSSSSSSSSGVMQRRRAVRSVVPFMPRG